LFNSTAFLNPILDNTAAFGFNADNTCEKDIAGAAAKCVWEDNFHVNTRVHDLMAQAMVPGLQTVGF
jgi:phospholipase/lecithinase/hemolysin